MCDSIGVQWPGKIASGPAPARGLVWIFYKNATCSIVSMSGRSSMGNKESDELHISEFELPSK